MVPGERNPDLCTISSGRRKHQSGQRVTGDEGSIRLDAESLDLSENLEAFSGPQHLSVCVPRILPAPTLFQLETRSPGGSHGCLPSGLEGAESLCEPSWNLIARVLKKVEEQAVDLVLVAPVWPSQPWYPKLLSLLIAQPLRILDPPEEGCIRYGRDYFQS